MARTAAAAFLAAAALLAGCSSSPSKPADSGIGAWPTFLPSPSAAAEAHGSSTDPAMSFAGSPVVVQLGGGTVTVNVQGPSYPAGTKVGADAVRCTFTVLLSKATAPVDLARAHFDVLDHNGTTHQLDGGKPSTLRPGQSLTLRLASVVPSGEGLLRYSPDGQGIAAAWDYVAETD